MTRSKWIWHIDDFEVYHNRKLHIRRTEFDVQWPAFWKLDSCYVNVKFRKKVVLEKEASFTLYAQGIGYFTAGRSGKVPFGKTITLSEGEYLVEAYVFNDDGIPSLYGEGNLVTDETWECDRYIGKWEKVGCREEYSAVDEIPEVFKFSYRKIEPVIIVQKDNGVLYDFGVETFAEIRFTKIGQEITVYFGETELEALDIEHSIIRKRFSVKSEKCGACCFRYIYIPKISVNEVEFEVFYEYIPYENIAQFKCEDELINKIWKVSEYSLWLNSREFLLDGIKRDRWVWSGDAYQSYFVNRYLFFDEDIMKRTIIAIRGKEPVEAHINTIVDYSFYWIMSILDYYEMTADIDFVKRMYPKMVSLMEFVTGKLTEDGFVDGGGWNSNDWVFIDWADFDKQGPFCAEQMLLIKAYEVMGECSGLIGEDGVGYLAKAKVLKESVVRFYWDKEKGAFIDSFVSGKRNVTRHANIFAVMFGYCDEAQRESIIHNVFLNEDVPKIDTPYFKFYELEAMCLVGMYNEVWRQIRDYWGAMLEVGSTTFWEKFDPDKHWKEQLGMYGMKYGKSLCHAWGATPIYIIGRHFLGIRPTSPGYKTYEVSPRAEFFKELEAVMPIKNGSVTIRVNENGVIVEKNHIDE